MLSSLRNVILALLVGLLVGGFGGYYTKGKFTEADVVRRTVELRKADVVAVDQMQMAEKRLQENISSSEENVQKIRKEIKRHVPFVQTPTAKPEVDAGAGKVVDLREAGCPERTLSVGVAGMLNAARAGRSFDPAAWSNAESEAPSGITDQDFIDNDLEVVGQYHDLAKRHDALVDWVSQTVLKQNGTVLAE